jgi:hypothetical protein
VKNTAQNSQEIQKGDELQNNFATAAFFCVAKDIFKHGM